MKRTKKWIELVKAGIIPLIYLLFVSAEHSGLIDHWRKLDRVKAVADNFSLSYAPDASMPVYPNNPAWSPLITLIKKYSKAKLRSDREPQTVARFAASLSTQQTVASGKVSEWTSPSTPLVFLYRYYPQNPGVRIPPEEYTIVGTVGDLQSWITEDRNSFYFLWHDIVLSILALFITYSLWHMNYLVKP